MEKNSISFVQLVSVACFCCLLYSDGLMSRSAHAQSANLTPHRAFNLPQQLGLSAQTLAKETEQPLRCLAYPNSCRSYLVYNTVGRLGVRRAQLFANPKPRVRIWIMIYHYHWKSKSSLRTCGRDLVPLSVYCACSVNTRSSGPEALISGPENQ